MCDPYTIQKDKTINLFVFQIAVLVKAWKSITLKENGLGKKKKKDIEY